MSRTASPVLRVFGWALVCVSGVVFAAPLAPSQGGTGRVLPVHAGELTGPGACVDLATLGSAYTQNFDTLSNTAGSTTNVLAIPGWFLTESGGGARDNEQYAVDTGASNTGDTYSYGAAAATDRALGGLRSGTLVPVFGACFTNTSGSTITSLVVGYTGEQWRLGTAARTDQINFEYSTNATDLVTGSWTGVAALTFVTPDTVTVGAKNGNAAAQRTALAATIPALSIASGASFWVRWTDTDATGADDGLAVDEFSLTPNGTAGVTLSINDVSLSEGDIGTTLYQFTVSLSGPAGAGGVTFEIATADGTAEDGNPVGEDNDYVAQSLTGQAIPMGSSTYSFDVLVVGDATPEPNESFFVNVTSVVGASVADGQGQATILNDDVALVLIHDVQGNGAATPIPGATVSVEGVVIGSYQGGNRLQGFFLQEEDVDIDADPATSEGIFVFCGACLTPVAEGQRVRVTGNVSEFVGMTEITASAASSVVVVSAGNHLAEVTAASIDLPILGVVDDFYEAREGMLVTFVDTLSVSEYFELGRYGHIVLYEAGRPRQFTEASAPSVAGNALHLDGLSRRKVILDDDNNAMQAYLAVADGLQAVFHPRVNGGFSIGSQGLDFFRGGDLVNALTGVLHWDYPGLGASTWRIRPTAANPATFTVANPRPASPPAVGGAIKAAGMNLLNYFTTIDTTASTSTGPCGPSMTLDCRGADSVAELNRQRERTSLVVCGLDADVLGLVELENTTPNATITDLLGAVNARCGGINPYAFANTGGTLGTDAIRVQLIYRTGVLSPVGAPISDLDVVHNRPPTAQTFDVVDATNPAFGQRFTVVANHFKSKGCPGTGGDADMGDGQGCFNATRTAQAARLATWISSTVVPAAGDPDVLLVGDFNAYAMEDPITSLAVSGFTDLESALLGPAAYSYLFDGQLGHLDYALSSASLTAQIAGVGVWHINADEAPLFDYNDEIRDVPGEATFEEKPDGSALVPPRVVFQPASPYRVADHDPVLVGLFRVADLAITKVDTPDPVTAGENLVYTVTVTNNGPDVATMGDWSDVLPAETTFVSLAEPGGWSCTTPAVGAGGTVSCSTATLPVGSAAFTLTVAVSAGVPAGTVISNTAMAGSSTSDSDVGNNTATATTTVDAVADLAVAKVDTPDPVSAGENLVYTITTTNSGPSFAASVSLSDTLPAGTTFVSLASPGGWSCTTPTVGAGGTVACSNPVVPPGSAMFTLTVAVGPGVTAGTVLSNTADVSSATTDPAPSDNSATATTTVASFADLAVAKIGTPDPVSAGGNLAYTITATNSGPSTAASVSVSDTLPIETTFVSLASPGGWSCTTPAVGAGGTVACTIASFGVGNASFTLTVAVGGGVAAGTVITNTVTVSSASTDPTPGENSATATTAVVGSADLTLAKIDTPDPVRAGTNLVYTVTATNIGPSAAATVSLGDTLPAGTSFVSLASPGGWSCTTPAVGAGGNVSCTITSFSVGDAVFTLTVAVAPTVADGTVISNTATVSSATADPSPGNESSTATTTVATAADLAVVLVDSPDPVPAGGLVHYAITVTNNGPSDAVTIALADTLPANTTFAALVSSSGWSCSTPAVGAGGSVACNRAALAAGASATVDLDVTVDPAALPGAAVVNSASVSAITGDPSAANNSATVTTTVGASPAELVATKVVGGSFVPGGLVTYTIELQNLGPATQLDNPGDELVDVLPIELELVSASATGGSVVANTVTNTVTWNGSLAPGASVEITIEAQILAATPGVIITNQAAIAWDADGDGTNESAGVSDDPNVPGAGDATGFELGSGQSVLEIPTLDRIGLLLLLLALGVAGATRQRQRGLD